MCDNFNRKDSLAERLELGESYNDPGRYPVIENIQTTRYRVGGWGVNVLGPKIIGHEVLGMSL